MCDIWKEETIQCLFEAPLSEKLQTTGLHLNWNLEDTEWTHLADNISQIVSRF